jgi:uncharacterized integral membrane protein (TIGR00697 family)
MLEITTTPIINYLQSYNPEYVSILTLCFCYLAIIFMVKNWQEVGLYIYTSVAIIACNLQVLKAAEFIGYKEPVALGTLLYSSTFLVSDALTELYGSYAARRSIWLSFAASILLLLFMVLTLGIKPLNIDFSSEHWHFNEAHNALSVIFSPSAAILLASLTAFGISQFTDIYIFSKLKNLTQSKHLWLRTFLSISISAFIDSFIFNSLAWIVFNPNPVNWHTLFFTYIFGAYILQLGVAALNTPVLYVLLKVMRRG